MKGNRYLAETIGTFTLVFAGCGAIIVNDTFPGTLGHMGISIVFGLVVMAMIYSIGNISGAHLNPAVTLGFFFARRLEIKCVPGYLGCQIIGAVAAAGVLRLMFPDHGTLGATLPGQNIELLNAFIMEVILSFVLMFVILNVSTKHMEKGIMAGVAVGGTIALEALMGGPVTGASMNPARSLGPALVSGHLETIWLYIAAPVTGTFLAYPTCRWIQGDECCLTEDQNDS